MTYKEARTLSLRVWRYLRDNPDSRKEDLPSNLFSAIKNLPGRCPLCAVFLPTCLRCPLNADFQKCDGVYGKWANSDLWRERQDAATEIYEKISNWRIHVAIKGQFDPIRIEHIRCLKAAQELGDYVSVIVSGSSDERIEILRAIRFVDVVYRTEMSIGDTLRFLNADIFVKGGDDISLSQKDEYTCEKHGIRVL